jgi:hypothetical protein
VNTVRSVWSLAKVVETVTDKDGLVRKVKILVGEPNLSKDGRRTGKPVVLERPIHKLILLFRPEGENARK